MKKTYYRVEADDKKGLWYDKEGNYTGLIHSKFNFCNSSDLKMPFDKELIGWISVATSLDNLFEWFNKKEILKLQKYGFKILMYEAEEIKKYDKFNHFVIKQDTAKIVAKFMLFEDNIYTKSEVMQLCMSAAHEYDEVITNEDKWFKENL